MIGRGLFGFSMQLQGDIEGIAFVIGKGFWGSFSCKCRGIEGIV